MTGYSSTSTEFWSKPCPSAGQITIGQPPSGASSSQDLATTTSQAPSDDAEVVNSAGSRFETKRN